MKRSALFGRAPVIHDLTAALDYKALGATEAGGLLGFSVDAYGSYASTRSSGAWSRLTGRSTDSIGTVGVRASKGLPLPSLLAFATAALEVIGGLAIAVGLQARIAGLALALFGGEALEQTPMLIGQLTGAARSARRSSGAPKTSRSPNSPASARSKISRSPRCASSSTGRRSSPAGS